MKPWPIPKSLVECIDEMIAEATPTHAIKELRDHVVDMQRFFESEICRLAYKAAVYAWRNTPRPLCEWHEDDGDVLWWKFPINEPPYVGSPLCDDWPGYHSYWTKYVIPKAPDEAA